MNLYYGLMDKSLFNNLVTVYLQQDFKRILLTRSRRITVLESGQRIKAQKSIRG